MTRSAWLSLLLMGAAVLSACRPKSAADQDVTLAPVSALPADLLGAPVKVQEAYRFALANPDLLRQIPCYCGCGAVGHTSNYDCYVAGTAENGDVIFDDHAFG